MLLYNSQFKQKWIIRQAIDMSKNAKGSDEDGSYA
jgi:hypothetical protein